MDTKITTSLNNEQSTMAFESSRTAQSDGNFFIFGQR